MNREEQALQIRCVNFLRWKYSHLVWNHSPNEGKRSEYLGKILKDMGMRPGWPDLDIYGENITVHVEFKSKKGRQRDSQKAMQPIIEKIGHMYYIVRTYEEFVEICHKHFGPERDPDIERLRQLLNT